jgi:urease accessory protein
MLRLCHLVSPALPLGAFAYSQGLEHAVEAGWVHDEASALQWWQGLSRNALATLDLPVVLRLHGCWQRGDVAGVHFWNGRLLAARETAELRAEDLHLGRSLTRVLCELEVETARDWLHATPTLASMFTLAGVRWQLAPAETAAGYLWSWTENQVLAGVKLIPLGQSAGQRLLHQLIKAMPVLVEEAMSVTDEDIASSGASLVLGSALHESQYTRLFRS